MPKPTSIRPASLALALAAASWLPSAQALNIVFNDVGATPMSAQQLSAFQTAANYWESKLTDNVTVYLNVSFDNLGSNTLGTASWAPYQLTYSSLRNKLALDRTSAADFSAYSHLQSGPALSFLSSQPDQSVRLDNDGSNNNGYLWLTTANAKALGFADTPTNMTSPDATIKFSQSFADEFAYSRVNGQVPAGKLDFITVAEHEIGHALGFVSGVDSIDRCIDVPVQCGTQNGFENQVWFYALDLYRYSAAGALDLSVVAPGNANQPYLSLDGGATAIQAFSTGAFHGDGRQASHFSGGLTLMNATIGYGQSYDAQAPDLLALDAIGWNLAAPVPEPETYALLLSGLAVLGWARRRRA